MYIAVDTMWVLVAAALVFFMQAGFAMVESGFTRAKNAGNIIMKNLMDFSLGTIVFWFIGFGIMFAGSGPLFGGLDLFIQGDYSSTIPSSAFIIFQIVFCATAATIVSGAMAERTKFSAYCIYSIAISALIYPVSGHWIWGGGWLSSLGFHDFAGSTAVHMVGGVAALVGAKILGPRIGKFDKDGKPKAIPGHNLTLGALGVFILWFAWFGFNGGSTVSMSGDAIKSAADIFLTTNLAAAVAAATVMAITWIKYKKPDVSMTLNGALAGLVAITAGCDTVSTFGAAAIGVIAGFTVFYGIVFVEKILKIDDPVGAFGVHGLSGAVGTISVGLFSTDSGLLYRGGVNLLGVQALGVISVAAWVVLTMTIVFTIIKKTIGLRVSQEDELSGLDMGEHGLVSSYADFMPMSTAKDLVDTIFKDMVTPEIAVPVVDKTGGKPSMTKVTIITRQSKFEILKAALDKIGITGMTVTQVLGCGMQKDDKEYYRGVELEHTLLPKVKVDIVISKIPVQLMVETARKALYTGKVGDGKIFITDVKNVIKVRTGEEGFDALQDEE